MHSATRPLTPPIGYYCHRRATYGTDADGTDRWPHLPMPKSFSSSTTLRRETVMRQARAWVIGEFWPATADEYFAVAMNPADPHNAFVRQVVSYWEMAAAMVLHGAVSAELFVDCNAEGFLLLAKFAPILDDIRQSNPTFMKKTSEMIRTIHRGCGALRIRPEERWKPCAPGVQQAAMRRFNTPIDRTLRVRWLVDICVR